MKIDWDIGPVAHRGLHDLHQNIVENSPASVDAALEENLAIEIDLQVSSDDTAMVFHDFTLDRLTDTVGPVRQQTASSLAQTPYSTGHDRIMSLAELLEHVAGRVPIYIELKSDFSGDMTLVNATASLVNAYNGPVALMSFDPWMVKASRILSPRIPCGLVSGTFATHDWDPHAGGAMKRFALRHMLTALIAKPSFINYDISAISNVAPQMFRRMGLPLLTWTVRTEAQRHAAAQYTDAMVFEGFIPTADERLSSKR